MQEAYVIGFVAILFSLWVALFEYEIHHPTSLSVPSIAHIERIIP